MSSSTTSITSVNRQETAKKSVAAGFIESVAPKTLYDTVMKGIASNVKMGPFTATSGVILPYYLNASTNFLDKNLAPLIVELFALYIDKYLKPKIDTLETEVAAQARGSNLLIVGMEVAGGIVASQLAAMRDSPLHKYSDYVYVRKSKKTTGTCQQLEGPQQFTSRTSQSPPLLAVWVDDALSTGSSLLEGIEMLKQEYNIHVVASLYLVDRARDRKTLNEQQQKLANPAFDNVFNSAVYDLEEIDAIIPKKQ